MGKVAIFKRSDGGLSIAPIKRDQEPDESNEEFLDACSRRLIANDPEGTFVGIFDAKVYEDAYKNNGELRNAWDWNPTTKTIDVSLPKAKEVVKDKLRVEREPLLKENDVVLVTAVALGDEAAKQAALAEQKRLQDLPQEADKAASVQELLAITAEKI